jgi:uncharacterized protein YicC (UPF0701 family)
MESLIETALHSYGPAGLICLFLWTLREQMTEIKEQIKAIKEELRPMPRLESEIVELKRRITAVEEIDRFGHHREGHQ